MKVHAFHAIILGALLVGCGDGDRNPATLEPEVVLTPAETKRMENAYDSIAASADSLLMTTDPLDGFAQLLAHYRNLQGVDSAWTTPQGLFVKFTKGGIISWNLGSELVLPPYLDEFNATPPKLAASAGTTENVGDGKACLYNQQYDDEARGYNRTLMQHFSAAFQAAGYQVIEKNGSAVDLNLMQKGLKECAAVFFISHGVHDGTKTWVSTGEEGSLLSLMTLHFSSWVKGEIGVGTVEETRQGKSVTVSYYTFSEKMIESSYEAGELPHSLLYLVACQGMTSMQLASALIAKGAAAVVGWDETNCIGQATGKLLIDAMLGGKNLSEAYLALPAEARTDFCSKEAPNGARLVYHPPNGGTLQLTEAAAAGFQITSPIAGGNYSLRTLTLSGNMTGVEEITGGTVELNGIATVLNSSGKTFDQPLQLRRGSNVVKISSNGRLPSGRSLHADTTFVLNGTFAALDLWTELRWNTNYSDVDFHLLPPNSTISDLWTSVDCYYSNASTSWGCMLDVDNVDGYGPEHITLPSHTLAGDYRLFVHYFDDDGAVETSASVSISAKEGTLQHFGPYKLDVDGGIGKGDLWEVARISMPSGQITPVNQYYFLGSLAKGGTIPTKPNPSKSRIIAP